MLPEYDFSEGVRGKYTSRFRESRQDLLASAAALDRQAWLSHSLLAFQAFESRLVAYLALVFDREPKAAGKAVSAMLEALKPEFLDTLWTDLLDHTSVRRSFYDDLLALLSDRHWLVHKSFHDFHVARNVPAVEQRFEAIVKRSTDLSERLSSHLLERCGAMGMDRSEVEARTEEIVGEWASGRDAA